MKAEYIINDEFVGLRIDKAISEKDKDLSRVAIQRMIDNENIKVNGKKVKSSYKLNKEDKVTIEKEEIKDVDIKA